MNRINIINLKLTGLFYTTLFYVTVSLFMVPSAHSANNSNSVNKANNHKSHAKHNLMGSHGMVLISHPKHGLFASHLPLYRTPHDYQIIYRVSIKNAESKTQTQIHLNSEMVTILPDNFDLTKLIKGEKFAINTKLFKGHFERGGKQYAEVEMSFDTPVLIKKVNANFENVQQHVYIAKITNTDAVFAHKIQRSPSYDAIGFLKTTKTPAHTTLKQCAKPQNLAHAKIREQLTQCGISNIQYIETRDFK